MVNIIFLHASFWLPDIIYEDIWNMNNNRSLLRIFSVLQDVGLWLEKINLGSYRQIFKENGVNGEYLEGMSMFTTEQILRFIRRCHMKWGDFITLCKELRQIKGLSFSRPLILQYPSPLSIHRHTLYTVVASFNV